MKKKKLLIAIGVSFVVAVIIGLLGLQTISAQECRIIRILGRTDVYPLTIEPATIFINKGDCVVWFNRVFTEEIQVAFKEGKKCLDVTKSPMGYTLNASNCYVSTWMPFAATSSLQFMEKGTYKYVVTVEAKSMPGQNVQEGQIIVE
jgi:plastocyanin